MTSSPFAAALLLAAASQTVTAGFVTAPPDARAFRLGALELIAVRDSGYVTPNDGDDFGATSGPAAVARLLAAARAPTDRVSLPVDALVVRMPGRVVLIDSGSGPIGRGVLLRSLAMAGVSPAQITDVLITHSHIDHVGGLVGADGGLAFPRAAIRMSVREWAAMQRRGESRRLAAAIAPKVATFEPGRDILPGIRPVALYGHTPGHVAYEIASRGRTIEDIGDAAHSAIVSLAEPTWEGHIDEDPAAGAAARTRELRRLAQGRVLIFAPHFPFPGVGRIEPRGDGYVWTPAQADETGGVR